MPIVMCVGMRYSGAGRGKKPSRGKQCREANWQSPASLTIYPQWLPVASESEVNFGLDFWRQLRCKVYRFEHMPIGRLYVQ